MTTILQALSVTSPPDPDRYKTFYRIGNSVREEKGGVWVKGPKITAITVQDDVPGLHCNLRRVCVWIGDHLHCEMPYHSVEKVTYPLPEEMIP